MLIQVRPVDSVLDVADAGLADVERFGYFPLFSPVNPYRSDFFWSEFGHGVFGSPLSRMGAVVATPLGSHVREVVLDGSHEQMSRVATGRIITVVTDEEAIGDEPNGQDVGHSVCELLPAGRTPDSDLAVSFLAPPSKPRPAGVRSFTLVNLIPESFPKGLPHKANHRRR